MPHPTRHLPRYFIHLRWLSFVHILILDGSLILKTSRDVKVLHFEICQANKADLSGAFSKVEVCLSGVESSPLKILKSIH